MTPIVSRSNRRPLAIALVALAALVLLGAGCGETVGYTEATGDKTNGKVLFTEKCGGCHTLADAGTTGTIGPNLDDAFSESRRNGLGESTFVQVVRDQIAYPIEETSTGAPGMPANIVTGQDAIDVSTYVASVAGTGKPPAPAPTPTPTPTTPVEPGAPGDAAAGKVVFTSSCGGCHTLADAGTNGSIGPNLDDQPRSSELVTERVTNGKGAMPSFSETLTETQIADVSAYVSSVSGK
jgi:mono/diheme cytochrome c family protein